MSSNDKPAAILAVALALFGVVGGVIVAEWMQFYPLSSWQRTAVFQGLIVAGAVVAGTIAMVVMYICSAREPRSRRPKWGPAMLADIGVALIALAVVWHFSESLIDLKQRQATLTQQTDQLAPLINIIREYETKLDHSEGAKRLVEHILDQYEQVKNAIGMFEAHSGRRDNENRLASAERLYENLRIALIRDVTLIQTDDGRALILRIAPNTFRVTGPVPMMRAPNITFPDLPSGVTANIIENSNLGFTVVFSPLTIPIEHFPKAIASAEL